MAGVAPPTLLGVAAIDIREGVASLEELAAAPPPPISALKSEMQQKTVLMQNAPWFSTTGAFSTYKVTLEPQTVWSK